MKYINFEILEKYGYIAKQTTIDAGNMREDNNLLNILNELDIENNKIVKSKQTHSTNILCIDENTKLENLENIDGFITNKNYALITFYADCLPIFILDIKNNVYGLVHSGWRGSVNKILEKALQIFVNKYNSNKKDIIINFGVGISCENYEIKQDTVDVIKSLLNFDNMLLYKGNKIYLDNTLLNKEIALRFGIDEKNIYTNNYCTYKDNFYSYRRDKSDNRMVAIFSKKGDK